MLPQNRNIDKNLIEQTSW